MPERHPGIIEEPGDPSVPLEIRKANPPDPSTLSHQWGGEDETYTVTLQLSRHATDHERRALSQLAKRMRIYGSTLEISGTTLEEVKTKKDELQKLVKQVEAKGKADEEAEEVRRSQAQAEKEAEAERLQRLADEIDFSS